MLVDDRKNKQMKSTIPRTMQSMGFMLLIPLIGELVNTHKH